MYILHRKHCDTLSWIGSQFIFSKSSDFMLDLSVLCFYFGQLVNTFSSFYFCLGTEHYMHSQRKVGSLYCTIIYVKENWGISFGDLNLEFILFITWMAMDSPERVSSKMQPKYVTLEYCFILMSLYRIFSGFDFLILCLLPNKIDFVLSLPKWTLDSISVISLCWSIKQVSPAYSNSSQIYVREKGVVLKWILEELCIGGLQVLRKYS